MFFPVPPANNNAQKIPLAEPPLASVPERRVVVNEFTKRSRVALAVGLILNSSSGVALFMALNRIPNIRTAMTIVMGLSALCCCLAMIIHVRAFFLGWKGWGRAGQGFPWVVAPLSVLGFIGAGAWVRFCVKLWME